MTTFRNLLQQVRAHIQEIDIDQVRAQMESDTHARLLLDVRERDERDQGFLPGSVWIPRGYLEMRIEKAVPDKSTPLTVYCAGGIRSAFATKALTELGYTQVVSMAGGFTGWKQRGFDFEVPRTLSATQRARYSRHLLIPEIGEAGQLALLDARVLLVGAGGLGSPAAFYLAAAGVGHLGLVDSDVVDLSNLQRQILHTHERIGTPKVESARTTLNALNPDIEVETFDLRLSSDNILEVFAGYDIVVDGGDNFPTRYLINDACVHLGLPNVHGSVYRFEGQVTTFLPGKGPCYRCLYPEPPPPELAPSCQDAGVLGVLPGVMGLLQAIEVIKLITGAGRPLVGRLLLFEGLETRFRELKLRRDSGCAMCGDNAQWEGFADYEAFCSAD